MLHKNKRNYKFKNDDEIPLFTEKKLKEFWRVIEFSNEMKSAIQTFYKEVVVSQDNYRN